MNAPSPPPQRQTSFSEFVRSLPHLTALNKRVTPIWKGELTMLEGLAQSTLVMTGGYKTLTHDEIVEIFRNSL